MNFTELLFVVDNDGNEKDSSSYQIENCSKIATKDLRTKIENSFKTIRKQNGICIQVFIVDSVRFSRENLCLIDVHEFKFCDKNYDS